MPGSKSGCRDFQLEKQAEEDILTSSHSQSTLLLIFFLLISHPQLGVASSTRDKPVRTSQTLSCPCCRDRTPAFSFLMAKKKRTRFVFSFSTKNVSGMHHSNLHFLFKPFILMDSQKISNVNLFNHSMHFTVCSGF